MANRSRGRQLAVVFLLASSVVVLAQPETKPVEGLRQNTPKAHALVNARIVQASGRIIDKGVIVVRDGIIESVGAGVSAPADARVWDYTGLTIYPGFIDAYSHLGIPKAKKKKGVGDKSPPASTVAGYWNPMVRPEVKAADAFAPSEKELQALRKLGFTVALIAPRTGVFGGAGSVVSLSDEENQKRLLKRNATQHLAFATTRGRRIGYPTSLMGAIALIRQAFLDADWYAKAQLAYAANPRQAKPEENVSLAALSAARQANRPFVFAVSDDQDAARAMKLGQEFGLRSWLLGSGYEYRVVARLKEARMPVILPLNFPKAPAVDTPEKALDVSLAKLSHWEAAPSNPLVLAEAGVTFAFSTKGLKKVDTFPDAMRKALRAGLSAEAALTALTAAPARMLGLERQLGSIDPGKLADFVVVDGELFARKTVVRDVWVDGRRYEVEPRPQADARGKWRLTLELPDKEPIALDLEFSGKAKKLTGKIRKDSIEVKVKKPQLTGRRLTLRFDGGKFGITGVVRLSGRLEGKSLRGQGADPSGVWFNWSGVFQESAPDTSKKVAKGEGKVERIEIPINSPPGAFGYRSRPPQPEVVLVKGATIWTSGALGKLTGADLLVERGKIARVGANLPAPEGALVVDARGKHVTPGLIDAHSHTGATRGVNEVGQAVTAEVRIADARDSHAINFYRQLAGGLTAANTLHGSANPIGGQNQVVKLRWGEDADGLVIKDAIPGIKFALGENVKQSNWGDRFTTRYPQTRMGVEQLIRDRFRAAQDYERKWQTYRSLKRKKGVIPPRIDLELEALLEILRGKRIVHCHSYRQDEILMLCRVADDFGFKVGVFQHVLEGYKVAEAIAKQGAGASTFSDWWAYKFEVYDAIPYNGALMHDAGVVVSFNSDSGELARRLNLEAAKAVKYGGVSEEEALKFVTLNPAKQLRIDHRVGSLEKGKDADFVIWSGSPLSTYSKCEQTWIDGRKYFDLETDLRLRREAAAERARLIQKALASAEKTKAEGEKK